MGPTRSAVARSLSYDDPSPAGGAVVSNTPMQHCPAIHKLMSGSLLQPLSESPESRLCENGAVQNQPDPIQKLLMNPLPVAGTPGMPSLQLNQGESGVGAQIHPKATASGLGPAQHLLYVPNKASPAGMAGNVVSPHELLQRLTLVQQEQELLQPSLTTSSPSLSKNNSTQVQVSSPQRIPATVAPTLLLSPSVFTQTKATRAEPEPAEPRALSKTQLQATLLHLIKNCSISPNLILMLAGHDLHTSCPPLYKAKILVQQWAETFGKQLSALSNRYSGAQLLQKKYKDVEPIVKMQEVDGLKMVKEFAEEMENMLGRKMKSVKRMAETVEDADFYHEYNATLGFDYYNSMMINTLDEDGNFVELGGEFPLEENEHFNKLPVNTQQSVVQVPTNVYNKDPDILNGVFMSEALNDIFTSNFEKDPTLTWQYFGSSTGFFRLYPGIKWTPDENGVVTFDGRNRNWYIQAATSPKDIIIAVDISGSMKGLRLTIAKHTINTILDTLGENDFVNVIAYSDYVRYVEPCFKGILVQADLDNREHFKLLVEELQVKGEGKVKKAIKESFKILNEAAAEGRGSLCNQAIMLITDGAMEDFQQVFEEFNWPERKVRVFTYLIGRELTFADNVKWIACNNKGYYTHISTLADVQENVMEYLHVLSRPMVIDHDHDIIWTEAYMDSVLPNTAELFNTQAESLLLMTSVAMPVFSKKEETLSHGILLGVVGTDVPLKELMKLAPRYKYKDGKKLRPKPNYNSVDLSEVEWEDTEDALRTAMVKGESGTLFLDVRATVEKGKRVVFLKNEYFYTTINETPFSLGIVLTKGHGKNAFIGNVSVEEGLHDLTASDVTIANEWTYCETDIDPHHRKLTQFQAVVRYLTGKEPDLECDERLLQQTLFDAVVTAPMEAYWTALLLNASGIDGGVETAFLGTRSGLMRMIRYVGVEKRVAKKFLSPLDKENIFTLDHFPVWYRRAAENPAGRFLYYVPIDDSTQVDGRFVIAITSVTVSVNKKTAVAGEGSCPVGPLCFFSHHGVINSSNSHDLPPSTNINRVLSLLYISTSRYFKTLHDRHQGWRFS
ncbi:voltage-dependent calcium channel subunit alpha-2 delta-4 [Labeo rohita]|uniref:Voltage-dependent calcium channel subunit alpha-2 delta-4 n=1 Tax=Labeo rohita TaxID=84645 RepID=A0A498MFS8_LABRO|nr:voltage-dependent calcium channel subunit alpha-2 delta-4 [Labeo rohita]